MTVRLVASKVDYRYPGSAEWVVGDWSHGFGAGQVCAVTGRSGGGKSARVCLLGRMVRPSGGQVVLDGERVDHLLDGQRSRLRASRFGFVFQDAVLDSTRTVLDNVLEAALYRGQDGKELTGRARALLEEMGVSVPVTRRPGQISGGQAQRIAMCRALVGRPDVVIADEPTGNLDPDSATAVLGMLRAQAQQGACVVVVTHDPVVRNWADVAVEVGALPALAGGWRGKS